MLRRLLAALSLLSIAFVVTCILRADDRNIVARYQQGSVLTAVLYQPPFLRVRPNTFYGGAAYHLGWLLVPPAAYVGRYARTKRSRFLGTPLLTILALFFLVTSLSWMPFLDRGEFTPRIAPVVAFALPFVARQLRRPWCWLRSLRARRHAACRAARICPDCGYDLRATPTRCPECGFQTALPSPLPDAPATAPRP